MPQDLSGKPVPVALLADPFAHQLAMASQQGDLPTIPNRVNPADLLDPGDATGFLAVILLNSLATPLTLVESYVHTPANPAVHGDQIHYPAQGDRVHPYSGLHVIPAARPYPRAENHPRPQGGGGAWMGGVGVYGFSHNWMPAGLMSAPLLQRALAFSFHPDGVSGPLFAVAFRTMAFYSHAGEILRPHSAVTADLLAKYTSLADFYVQTMYDDPHDGGPEPSDISSDVGSKCTVWANYAQTAPTRCLARVTLTVWVRDASSTLGF